METWSIELLELSPTNTDFVAKEETHTTFEQPWKYYECDDNTKSLAFAFLIDPKLRELRKLADTELTRYKKFLEGVTSDIKGIVNELIQPIASIEYESVVVELTPSAVLKFKIVLSGNQRVIISKPLTLYEDIKIDDVIFSVFFGRECILSDVRKIHELVQGINRFRSMQASIQ